MEAVTFACSICGEDSRDICIACTKDTCANHLCERCKRCSDCCVCEVRLINHHEQNGKGLMDTASARREAEPVIDSGKPEPAEQTEADENSEDL